RHPVLARAQRPARPAPGARPARPTRGAVGRAGAAAGADRAVRVHPALDRGVPDAVAARRPRPGWLPGPGRLLLRLAGRILGTGAAMSVSRFIVIGLFIVAALLFVAMQALSRRPESHVPSFGDLTATVLSYEVGRIPVGRIGVYGFYWWLGW